MKDTIMQRMGELREELRKADEELRTLRPRVQYLESVMMRVDGALTVLQELLDVPDASNGIWARAEDHVPVAS